MGESNAPAENHNPFERPSSNVVWRDANLRLIHFLNKLQVCLHHTDISMVVPTTEQKNAILDGVNTLSGNLQLYKVRDIAMLRRHMAFTLFVAGGVAARAAVAVRKLEDFIIGTKAMTVDEITQVIRPLVRFPAQKAARLVPAFASLPEFVLQVPVEGEQHEFEQLLPRLRRWLTDNINGMGPKVAAHFMRNTGLFTANVAYPIIDTHIVKVLNAFGHEISLDRLNYTYAENAFCKLAFAVDIPVLHLDAALWCALSGNWNPDAVDFGNWEMKKAG